MLKIGVLGCNGRMGRYLLEEISKHQDCELSAGVVRSGHSLNGKPLKTLLPQLDIPGIITDKAGPVFEVSDVIIDFTTPGSTGSHVELCDQYRKPLVVCTTAFSQDEDQKISQAGERVPILQAMNTSLGITLLMDLVAKAASCLDETYDIEVFERHHNRKKDAPSGTALKLGEAAAKSRGRSIPPKIDLNREGLRKPGEIGFVVSRGGNVTADQSVAYLGEKEMLTLSHRAFCPSLFAEGALKAAKWLVKQSPGRYTMHDVLGLGKGS